MVSLSSAALALLITFTPFISAILVTPRVSCLWISDALTTHDIPRAGIVVDVNVVVDVGLVVVMVFIVVVSIAVRPQHVLHHVQLAVRAVPTRRNRMKRKQSLNIMVSGVLLAVFDRSCSMALRRTTICVDGCRCFLLVVALMLLLLLFNRGRRLFSSTGNHRYDLFSTTGRREQQLWKQSRQQSRRQVREPRQPQPGCLEYQARGTNNPMHNPP